MSDRKIIVGGVAVAAASGTVVLLTGSGEKVSLSGPTSAEIEQTVTYTSQVVRGRKAQSGVTVQLLAGGNVVATETTDSTGHVSFSYTAPSSTGSVVLQAKTSKASSKKITLTVTDAAGSVDWKVSAEKVKVSGGNVTVSGTVYDVAGNPYPGFRLGVFVNGVQQGSAQTSDSKGKFSFLLSFPKNTTSSNVIDTITLQEVKS